MRIFWKNCKNRLSDGGSPPSNPSVMTLTYYYNLVVFISSELNAFYYQKKEQNNCRKFSAFASPALFHLFFTSNSVGFVDGGARIFLTPGRRVP